MNNVNNKTIINYPYENQNIILDLVLDCNK